MKYYDLKPLLKKCPDADYYIIIGQRSNGKSTAVGKYMIDECMNDGSKFAYFSRLKNSYLIKDFEEGHGYFSGYLEKYTKFKYNKELKTHNNNICIGNLPLCTQFYISTSAMYKSKQYINYKYIVFEEFVSENGIYLRNEWVRFNSLISTITRNNGAKVFLIGNTISRFNPYFENLEIDVLNLNLKPNDIKEITTSTGAKVAIEFSGNVYENENEIANVLKVNNNSIALQPEWIENQNIITKSDIYNLLKLNKSEAICSFIINNQNTIDRYVMYCIYNDDYLCNIIFKNNSHKEKNQALKDNIFYLNYKTYDCIMNNVKSFVDCRLMFKSSIILQKIFNLPTFFSDDRIAFNYNKFLLHKQPFEKVGDEY